ncbi:uncharacterized protein LOC121615142 isoform X6 [Chelmon rostratus]|uniref:uncharacterized protein LOC121615142 isoform X6 n=1 Tax=Chelmon rostratus TaxID=109905 RepID=UPI001BE4E3FB|nr:uncharacterized protein LOC121615142 isoform X6 [Chelmon rostratus]
MCVCGARGCRQTPDEPVAKPVASVYPAAPGARLEGRSALLCLASAMFPPVVRFSWKRRKENGPLEEPPPAETEQLELRESGRAAAILLIHQLENSTYDYICYVQHEGGKAEAPPVPGNEGSRLQLQQLPVLQRESRQTCRLCSKLTCQCQCQCPSSLSAG